MDTTFSTNGSKIPRPTVNGRSSQLDKRVQSVLAELDALLSKRVIEFGRAEPEPQVAGARKAAAIEHVAHPDPIEAALTRLLVRPLTPRKADARPKWANDSIADFLLKAEPEPAKKTLSELIDATPELAKLKFQLKDYRARRYATNDATLDEILNTHTRLLEYLVGYAFVVRQIKDVDSLADFVYEQELGVRALASYAAVSAARDLVREKRLSVENYNSDEGAFVDHLRAANLPLTSAAYEKAALDSIDDFQFNRDEAELIKDAHLGPLPEGLEPLLIKSIQQFPIPITKDNAKLHLPTMVAQLLRSKGYAEPGDIEPTVDQDFDVQFHDEIDTSYSDISRSAVRCAAQLFHSMVLGDQLDVFGAVDYFTHRFLLRGGMELRDRRLRSDLQLYVFSNRFVDLQTNRVTDRTRAAERRMFYRQVFNEGTAETTEDLQINTDFKRLWNVLILEGGKYLQRASSSLDRAFVSQQQVMQAVEDLQYNLSTACTGMVNVIGPMIDAELNFVLTRILRHPEVIQAVTPSGGTWKRTVEALCVAARKPKPRAATLYNRASYGKTILQSIADYDARTFATERIFDPFIGAIDALITTQSILQDSVAQKIVDEDTGREPQAEEPEESEPGPKAEPDPNPKDEWDF